MESNTLFCSALPSLPLPSKKSNTQKLKFGKIKRSKVIASSIRRGSNKWDNTNKHAEMLVDESMIVLRKRIHEMKMIERNYEPPAEWMEWEKQCYASYDHFICKFVGFLQFHLMNTRPSLAIGILFLISMSVPLSTVMIAQQLMDAANGVLSAVHLG